ncbi:MAG: hypothetical protein K6C94_00740 [Candidatus Gastranaerophilales bacterium]|nr:hypothetical protein [Candidatus Gastranaerophilales bacterium]
MKNFCIKFLTLIITVIISSLSVFADTDDIYKFCFVEDTKTKKEFARTIVPDDFIVSTSVKWERDYENPVSLTILAQSKDKTTSFLYSSAKTYVDSYADVQNVSSPIDTVFLTEKRAFAFPQEFVKELISANNPNAQEVVLVSSFESPEPIKDYLMSEMLKKMDDLKTEAKSDRRFSKVSIGNPYFQPFASTYSYTLNNQTYKQTVIAMISSFDYEFTKKTSVGKFEKFPMKLWFVSDLYVLKAKETDYDKYYEKFIIFVANTMINRKAENSLRLVKQQMKMELSPTYVDVHTGSNLKNLPSDLFNRYYEGGLPLYQEDKDMPMQKPSLQQVRWFTNVIYPQNRYKFVKLPTLWNQPVYVPQKYQCVYFDKVNNRFALGTTMKEHGKGWVHLILSNIIN